MAHNLTVIAGKGILVEAEGKQFWLTGARMFSRTNTWHRLGHVDPSGFYTDDGLKVIDPKQEMEMMLVPSGYVWNGKMMPDGHANVISHIERDVPVVYGKVKAGIMTPTEWREMNPATPNRPTRSKLYEVISPSQIIYMLNDLVKDENGNRIKAESMGFLGKDGEDGLFVTYRLQDWDTEVSTAIQSEVKEYMVVYVSWDGMMYVYNTSIVVVCQNTLMASLKNASRVLKVDHQLGAFDRLKQASTGIFEGALNARMLMQDAAMFLMNTQVSEAQVKDVVESIYRNPGEPDEQLLGVRSWEARMKEFDNRTSRNEATRTSIVKMWKDEEWHKIAGITPNMKGSAFAAYQAVTFLETYRPEKSESTGLKRMLAGYRRSNITQAFDSLLSLTNAPMARYAKAEEVVLA